MTVLQFKEKKGIKITCFGFNYMKKYRNLVDINNKDECRGIRMVQRFAVEEICYKCLLIFILEYDQSNRSFVKIFRYSLSETSPMFFNRLKSDFILVRSPQNFHQ